MSDMAKNLERIKNAAGHLNKLAEEANAMIRVVWRALESTHAGLPYESPNLHKNPNKREYLGWSRHDGKLMLMHQSSDTGSQWRRLIDAPREARIRVAQSLPAFVYSYAKHVSSHLAKMEKAMAEARESGEELSEALKLCSLPPSPPPPPRVSGVEDRPRSRWLSDTGETGEVLREDMPPLPPGAAEKTSTERLSSNG